MIYGLKNNMADFLSFNNLAVKVFDLSFEKWYTEGYCSDKYLPYTYFEGGKAVANVSVNRIQTLVDGKSKLYLQLGTVMTDPDFRGQGLCRRLLEEVLQEWGNNCDGIYLYANDTVLDFYPKFGFEKAKEYQYTKRIIPEPQSFEKLNMRKKEDVELLKSFYSKNNPFSSRPMLDNFELLMFYCGNFMEDTVYYSERLQTIVIASFDDDNMICYDIYCDDDKNPDDILKAAAQQATRNVAFGFTPEDAAGCSVKELEDENQLFVYRHKENMFNQSKMMVPLLSHA